MAAVVWPEQTPLVKSMGMFQLLQSGKDMDQVQGVLGRPGKQEIGWGENDMVFAVAATYGWALAVKRADLADIMALFLDSIKLPDVEGIADRGLADKRRFGTEMGTQAFDLVGNLLGS